MIWVIYAYLHRHILCYDLFDVQDVSGMVFSYVGYLVNRIKLYVTQKKKKCNKQKIWTGTFTKAEIQMINKYMKTCLISLLMEKSKLELQWDTTKLSKSRTSWDTMDSMKEARVKIIYITWFQPYELVYFFISLGLF